MTPALATRLDGLLESAARDLQRLSGGAAVCTFTRAGVPVPGIKYAEGRWASLRELQRELARTAAGGGTADAEAAARSAHARWTAELATLRARNAGADWIAYRTGGTDALTDLIDPSAT